MTKQKNVDCHHFTPLGAIFETSRKKYVAIPATSQEKPTSWEGPKFPFWNEIVCIYICTYIVYLYIIINIIFYTICYIIYPFTLFFIDIHKLKPIAQKKILKQASQKQKRITTLQLYAMAAMLNQPILRIRSDHWWSGILASHFLPYEKWICSSWWFQPI